MNLGNKADAITRAMSEGLRHHRAGELEAACKYYRKALAVEPGHSDALHLLGVVAHQQGDNDTAIKLIEKAIEVTPQNASYHNNLGECWRALENHNNAEECFKTALSIEPNYPNPYLNLGNVYNAQNRIEEAIRHYSKVLELRPRDPKALGNLGSAYAACGRNEEALKVCQEAIALAPELVVAWINAGVALHNLGRNSEALIALRRAIALAPRNVNGINHLGRVLLALRRWREAFPLFQSVVRLDPADVQGYVNLANLAREMRDHEGSRRYAELALELRPELSTVWSNAGLVAQDVGLLTLARKRIERSLELDPKNGAAWNNLGGVFREMAEIERAIACYRKAAALGVSIAESNVIFAHQFGGRFSKEEICEVARRWGERTTPAGITNALGTGSGQLRIRIGYLSPDFRAHPVGYFISGLLDYHDKTRFEIFCYSDTLIDDEWTQCIKSAADRWVNTYGMNDMDLISRIKSDRIDLLVDLAGHTSGNRLSVFAHKPARYQAAYLGYPGSTGLKAIDVRITDALADPIAESKGEYVERLALMPRCAWCYRPPVSVANSNIHPASARGAVTFVCFNNYAKASPEIITCWSRIIKAVDGSRLILKSPCFSDVEFRTFTASRFREFGMDEERLILRGRDVSLSAHLLSYDEADIALDTFPYHGTTTTCDALWMGVPVVTWKGKRHASRVGVSLLNAVGLDELVANTLDEYIEKAVALANDGQRLARFRSCLRPRMERSELMDGRGLAKQFERIVENIIS